MSDGVASMRRPPLSLVLGLAYPVVAHVAILSGRPGLVIASVALLGVLLLLEPLRRGRAWAWLLLAAGAAGLWQLDDPRFATLPLFAPPVLITAGVAWLFGRSLVGDATPLIEQIARAMTGADLDAGRRRYARQVTIAWATITGMLAVVNLVLALLAEPQGLLLAAGLRPFVTVPLATWSLFANLVNYLVLGAMFVLEFAWRRHRFPDEPHGRFVDFIRGLARLGPLFARTRRER